MEINKDYTIIDNFLDKEIFLNIKNTMQEVDFPWFLQKKINDNHNINDFTCYFTHRFFYQVDNNFHVSNLFNLVIPIIIKLNIFKLIRIKGNVYPYTKEKMTHEKHIDYDFENKGAIFYINTNDGNTILGDNIEINSIENRLLLFNPRIPHSSTSTTDSKFRMNINFNYL